MEQYLPIIIQLVAGAVGGNVLGAMLKNVNLGGLGNTIAGAVGGVGATWLAGMIPGLDGLVGAAASMAGDAAATAGDAGEAAGDAADMASGLDVGALLGQGGVSLVGGGILTAIAGMVRGAMGANS